MTRILITTMPADGHVRPGLPLVHELVAAGHDVAWYTGAKYVDLVERAGATALPFPAELESDFGLFEDRPEVDAEYTPGIRELRRDILDGFIAPVPAQVRALTRIVRCWTPDVIVSDSTFVAGPAVAEREGIPSVAFSVVPLVLSSVDTAPFGTGLPPAPGPLGRLRNLVLNQATRRVVMSAPQRAATRLRADLGLPALPGFFMDWVALTVDRFLVPTVPSFEYPRRDLPSTVRFVGPFLPTGGHPWQPPTWWTDVTEASRTGRPVIVVTQGTLALNPDNLLRPAIRALADHDALVVATTGGPDPDTVLTPDERPANLRLTPFVPFAELLPMTDLMITNGGYGGVQFALAHGVPVVGAGTTEDKMEVNARVAWSGAGVNLRANRPTPSQISAGVRTVLADGRFRSAAQRLQAEYAQYDGARSAVRAILDVARRDVAVSTAEFAG